MKWGIWHRSSPSGARPLADCEANSHDEAKKKLLPQCPITASETKVEPLPEPGRSHVGRFFTQTGPVLSDDDLAKGV